MTILPLSAQPWELKGFWPWVPLQGRSMETSSALMGVTDWIPATVPGGVHYDLYRAGLIPHPHRDLASLHCEWVEHRWWLYRTTLVRPDRCGRRIELHCRGLDYEVGVYANDRHLGDHRGMFHPAGFDLTALFAAHERIELKLLFRAPPEEMGQIGRTSQTFTQKSRFGYKWDFSTRLVNIGLWDEIELRVHDDWSLGPVSVQTDVDGATGLVRLDATVERIAPEAAGAPTLDVSLADPAGREVFHAPLSASPDAPRFATQVRVDEPQLWFPNGHGAQPLYTLRLRLLAGGRAVDERRFEIGLRRLDYARNPGGPPDALPYTFLVNGRRLYIQGVNLTPLDHLYGNVTDAHYAWIVRTLQHARVNLVRVWGGGVIERTRFYELCDRHGILVWQEFIQSSSGVDNIPSQRPEFLALLHDSAVAALQTRRNHTCLAVWSGGNELMDAANVPSTLADPNLALLHDLVRRHDPGRLFLPTSASGLVEHMTTRRGVMHDVHGHWKYQGPVAHYPLYAESDSLFHSEFGVDGCSDVRSLRKFLGAEHQHPTTMADSLVWRHHGEWWDTAARDREFFGAVADLAVFADGSQWIQAEGLRFILEANRRREPRNSGSIVWQLNEPWPNVACTNLVDYYGEKKMACYWARTAFAPLHVSLDYRSLVHAPGTRFHGTLHLHHSGATRPAVRLRVEVLTLAGERLHDDTRALEAPAEASAPVGEVGFPVTPAHGEMFFVRLTLAAAGREPHENLYVFSTRAERLYAPALALQPALAAQPLDDWSPTADGALRRAWRIANRGPQVALFVRPEETTNAWWLEADHAFVSLFPGETRDIAVTCRLKRAGGFLREDQPPADGAPKIRFRAWAQSATATPATP
jgi:beta-mannosidase